MLPEVMAADERHRAPAQGFRARTFFRALRLIMRYRAALTLGLIATVLFAALHSASIGVAYPVFKVVLEEEGLQHWADRSVAGDRLGVTFALPADETEPSVRLTNLSDKSPLYAQGVRAFDLVRRPDGGPIRELFREVASAQDGSQVTLAIEPAALPPAPSLREGGHRGDVGGELTIPVRDAKYKSHILLWAASKLPAGGNQQRIDTLKFVLLLLIVVVIAANLCRYAGEVFIAQAVLRGLMDLRAMLYERTLQMPMSFFAAEKTADLVTKFVQDIQELQRGMQAFLGKFIREPLRGLFLLGLALVLDWRITVVMLIIGPLAIVVFGAVGRKVKKANSRLLRGYGEMIGALTASLQNIRVVKAYTAERIEGDRLTRVDQRMFKQQLRLQQLQALITPLMETVAVLGGSLVTVWLAGRVLGGEISLSKFLTLGACLSILFDPLRKLSDVYVRIVRSSAGADRIFAVLDATLEAEDTRATEVLGPLSSGIEFQNVRFTYPGGARPAIDGVTLHIAEGETVALVGPNGSGKTTLAGMIPRFFDPDFGAVTFDGTDLRDATLKSLRDQISLVTQDAVVFAGTPVENIAYGDAAPDAERAIEAARQAHASEFIEALPRGYDEILGERGTTLSGGQRQRLTIARAIYRDAPILIFDEATSQIDSESELKIQGAIKSFARGRTTIIIAHRLSTIQFADRIVVMDQGTIVDSGTHAELFDRCPLYHTLCETQLVSEVAG